MDYTPYRYVSNTCIFSDTESNATLQVYMRYSTLSSLKCEISIGKYPGLSETEWTGTLGELLDLIKEAKNDKE